MTADEPEDVPLVARKQQQRLTFWHKVAYGAASFPHGLIVNIKGFFLNAFLLEVALMKPEYAGIILLGTKAVDAVTDPVVGRLSDRTKTRWGKRRPWMLLSALPLALAWIGLWQVPPAPEQWQKVIFYFCMVAAVDTLYTCFYIPYTTLAAEITTDYDERTSITTFQSAFVVLGGVIPSFIHAEVIEAFPLRNDTMPLEYSEAPINYQLGYALSSVIMAFLILGPCLLVFFSTMNLPAANKQPRVRASNFLRSVKMCFQQRSFLWAMLVYFCLSTSIQFVQNNLLLYVQICLGAESQFSYLLLTINMSTLFFLVAFSKLSVKIGKTKVYCVGVGIICVIAAGLFFLPYLRESKSPALIPLLYICSFFAGAGVSINFLVPYSMLPDCIDEFELQHGERNEGVFYSLFVFFQKLGLAVALAASNFALAGAGFNAETGADDHAVDMCLRYLLGVAPVCLFVVSFVFVWLYPLTRERHAEISTLLAKRKARGSIVSTSSLDVAAVREAIAAAAHIPPTNAPDDGDVSEPPAATTAGPYYETAEEQAGSAEEAPMIPNTTPTYQTI